MKVLWAILTLICGSVIRVNSSQQLLLPFSSRFGEVLQMLKNRESLKNTLPAGEHSGNFHWELKPQMKKTERLFPSSKNVNLQPENNLTSVPHGKRGGLYPLSQRLIEGMVSQSIKHVPKPPSLRPVKSTALNAGCTPGGHCEIHLKSFETDSAIFHYAYSHSSSLPPVVQAVFDETQSGALPPPLIWKETVSPEVVQLTMNLMKALRPNRALIVGVFTGLSVVGAAVAVNDGGLVIGVEYPQYVTYWENVGNKYAQQADLLKRIQLRTEFAVPHTLDLMAKKEPGSFDFILLDDISQENYMVDYERCIVLLRTGGVLLINDVFVGGGVLAGPSVRSSPAKIVAQMNRKLQSDIRVMNSFIPIGGGVTIVTKK